MNIVEKVKPGKIAFVVFDGMTMLDFIGIYDPITRLRSMKFIPELEWEICSFTFNVADSFGLTICPDKIGGILTNYDTVIIPGGMGTRFLMNDAEFLSWIKTIHPNATIISVCTGSLILGAAGFLSGKKATTHFREYATLKPFCNEVVEERIVEDGNVITAGAVSSAINLGLYLCQKWAGSRAMLDISANMNFEYRNQELALPSN